MIASDSGSGLPIYSKVSPWIALLVFVLLTLLIGATGYFIFEQNRRTITEEEVENLGAIADLKVAQIVAWRESLMRRGEAFLYGSALPTEFVRWQQEGARPNGQKQKLLQLLISMQHMDGYTSISLLDRQGTAKILPNAGNMPDTEEMRLAVEAMRRQRVLFSDFHKSGHGSSGITIDFAVPLIISGEKEGTHVVGAALFEVDPQLLLFPLIQSWPTKSASAETLLVRRDGDDVLFLNELRFKKGTALSLRIPLTNTQLPAAQAVRQQLKSTDGRDYREVAVVAALRSVPDTPWFMVAKIDKEELLAPAYKLRRWVTGLGFAFIVFGGVLVFLWLKGHQARHQHLQDLHDAAVEREMLLKHFDYLSRYANDIVLLVDAEGRIVEANDRAVAAYGYLTDQLKSMSLRDLLSPGSDLGMDEMRKEIENKGGLRFESVHIRKDKTAFPVESSVRAITFEGKTFYQSIIRDITERKQAEDALWQKNRFIQQVIDTDPNLIYVKDAEGRFVLVNQAMADLHRMTPQELVGRNSAELFPNKEQFEPYLKMDREVIETRRQVVAINPNWLSGKERWFLSIKTPMVQPDGTLHVLGIALDVTERKLAEEKLNESYKELQKLATHLEVVREDEQKRIARELHDEMGSVLAALNINVSLLAKRLPAEMAHLKSDVDSLAKLVDAGIRAMRHTIAELRPSLLDHVGLKFAIERYVEEFQKNTGIECELRLSEDESMLDGKRSAAIFRIIQESLTNVAKHAQANKVNIVLSYWDESLVLTVKDNGKGFDPNARKVNSFGLLGIRERASLVGGRAEISSAVGRGTTVRVILPRSSWS